MLSSPSRRPSVPHGTRGTREVGELGELGEVVEPTIVGSTSIKARAISHLKNLVTSSHIDQDLIDLTARLMSSQEEAQPPLQCGAPSLEEIMHDYLSRCDPLARNQEEWYQNIVKHSILHYGGFMGCDTDGTMILLEFEAREHRFPSEQEFNDLFDQHMSSFLEQRERREQIEQQQQQQQQQQSPFPFIPVGDPSSASSSSFASFSPFSSLESVTMTRQVLTQDDKTSTSGSERDVCSICHGSFNVGEECLILSCQHRYHAQSSSCGGLETWLKIKHSCPLCRRTIK